MSWDCAVRVLVLGPCGLEVAGAPVALTTTQRHLVARLAVTPRQSVPLAAIVEALWASRPPQSARTAVHNQVSRLRGMAGRELIQTTADGYLLAARTDVEELVGTVWEAERVLATDPERTLCLVDRAREVERGEPFADLSECSAVAGVRQEVATVLGAVDDLEVEAALTSGLVVRALATAVRLRGQTPYDEARAARLARAFELAGRRGDALDEVARFRRDLRIGLGLEPSGPMLAVEASLHQAPAQQSNTWVLTPAVDAVLGYLEEGRSVVVSGPRGSGISALMRSLRAQLTGRTSTQVASARVQGYRDVAVAVLLDLLDELGQEPSRALGPVGSFLPALTGLAAEHPVLLLVDDADLAGPSSEWALAAAAAIPGVRLVLGIHQDHGGFAELPRVHVHDGIGDDLGYLRRVVRAEAPDAQRALVAAAVMGADAPPEIFGLLGAEDGLRQALNDGVLQRSAAGPVGFVQARMREAVLAEAPVGLLEEMHHTLGRNLLDGDAAVEAARHLIAAPSIEPSATLQAARAAAAAARASGAHLDAADWLRRALDATDGLVAAGDRLALLIELGDVLRLAGAPEHVDVLVSAVEGAVRLGDDDRLGEALFALLQLGGTTVSTTLDAGLQGLLRRGMSRLQDPEQVALVKGAASLALSMTGHADRSRRLFREAERAARSDRARMRVLPFAYLALGLPGDLEQRATYAEELIGLGVAHADPIAEFEGLHIAYSAQVQRANGAGLRPTLERMTELVDRVGDVGRRWALLYLSAAQAHLEGDLDEAERIAAVAHEHLSPVAESRATAALYGQVFGLALARGTVADLGPFVSDLVADQPGVPAWHAVAALCLAEQSPAAALDQARHTLDSVERDFTWLAAHVIGGRAAALVAAAGVAVEPGLLTGFAARLSPYSGQVTWQGTCSYGPVDTTLALLAHAQGDADRAHVLAARAAAQAVSLRAPVFAADLDRLGLVG